MAKPLRAELLELFFYEVETYIPEMQQCIVQLYEDPCSLDALEELHRLFHNIKGASSQVELVRVSGAAKKIEIFLDEKIENRLPVDNHMLDYLGKAVTILKDYSRAKDSSDSAEKEVNKEFGTLFGGSPLADSDHSGRAHLQEMNESSWPECCEGVSSVLPLLQEMVTCLTSARDGGLSVTGIYRKLYRAVSILAETVYKTGMTKQGALLVELEYLLEQLALGKVRHHPEMAGLVGDFFQYLELIFANENPEESDSVERVQQQLSHIYSVSGLKNDTILDLPKLDEKDLGFALHALFDELSEDEDTIAFMEQLDDSELLAETGLLREESLKEDLPEKKDLVDESDLLFEALEEGGFEVEEDFTDSDKQLLLEIFREECDEHLIVINQSLNTLEAQVHETTEISLTLKNPISDMRRAMHTLKGAASVTGVSLIARGAHSLEDMLDWLHDSASEMSPEDVRLLATGIDLIEILAQDEEGSESARLERLIESVNDYLSMRSSSGPESMDLDVTQAESPIAIEEISDKKKQLLSNEVEEDTQRILPGETGSLRVRLDDLDELQSIEGELVVARGAMEKLVEEFSETIFELDNVRENLRRKSQELEAGFEVQALYGFNPGGQTGIVKEASEDYLPDFDPIELDRYSELNLIIRSLNEITVDVNSIWSTLTSLSTDISGQLGKQQLTMRLMQDKLMRIRMTPLSSISRLLFRTVRETGAALGKKVNLTISGEDVYMDRFVWTKVTDPLLHLLRNSVDHGIESAEKRRMFGKPDTGAINIQVEQRSRYVILRLSDDGAGVDMDSLKQKIQSAGLVGDTSILSERELLDFLFHPGFSTKEAVSTVSGRGVGLDVVKRNVQDMRGTVGVTSQFGEGTTFELLIPSTLSVNRAVIISVAHREYAVPLQDIEQVRHFAKEEIATTAEGTALRYGDTLLSCESMGNYLQLEQKETEMLSSTDGVLALLFHKGDQQFAISIDSVTDQREIVVKNLGSHLTHVHGVSGVTLTGSGMVIPILNIGELVETQRAGHDVKAAKVSTQIESLEPLKVLIVDDSISVRHSVARLVESQSWQQQQAIDGMDALAKLESFKADLIILDVEMPRMNGYEFKSNINNHKEYRDIPVVMLTSRSSEKHRLKGLELGVDHYVTKPYQDEPFVKLLENIQSKRMN